MKLNKIISLCLLVLISSTLSSEHRHKINNVCCAKEKWNTFTQQNYWKVSCVSEEECNKLGGVKNKAYYFLAKRKDCSRR